LSPSCLVCLLREALLAVRLIRVFLGPRLALYPVYSTWRVTVEKSYVCLPYAYCYMRVWNA
jgi:hypothetical protein